jgi:hypothetical protein
MRRKGIAVIVTLDVPMISVWMQTQTVSELLSERPTAAAAATKVW